MKSLTRTLTAMKCRIPTWVGMQFFASYVEIRSKDHNVEKARELLCELSALVTEHGGLSVLIDGHSLIAFWRTNEAGAERALEAAFTMREWVSRKGQDGQSLAVILSCEKLKEMGDKSSFASMAAVSRSLCTSVQIARLCLDRGIDLVLTAGAYTKAQSLVNATAIGSVGEEPLYRIESRQLRALVAALAPRSEARAERGVTTGEYRLTRVTDSIGGLTEFVLETA